jgi:hypothetical protein
VSGEENIEITEIALFIQGQGEACLLSMKNESQMKEAIWVAYRRHSNTIEPVKT